MAIGEGLTQQQATLIAGGLAVFGAGVAFIGVLVAQYIARKNVKDQMDKLSAVEAEKHRRQVSHDAMVRCIQDLSRVRKTYTHIRFDIQAQKRIGIVLASISDDFRDRCNESLEELDTSGATLMLIDPRSDYSCLESFAEHVRGVLKEDFATADQDQFDALWAKSRETLQSAYALI